MKETERLLEELLKKAEAYGYSSLEVAKLKSVRTTAAISGRIAVPILVLAVVGLVVLMISLTMAFWLGELWGAFYLGFAAVSGFYVLMAIVFSVFRVQLIQRPIENFVLRLILE